ncbi:hypothetical protein SAMN05216275_12756 [Streptosporangium canum]|uniref:Uncharacterized protein n=1 Tax=Streptosporangium canum TaxID=324952 RepID=A0A1I4A678_9ACTN|nr:hypothetical protein [Streptosporangium canum]SFK51441.1 hypothetical protein SAMN05216275_12756 [Streptosporangium canum]
MHPYEQADELCQAVDELGVRIYTALRDGGLDADPLVDLACLMKEWGAPSPVTRELLERLATELTAADLARLGEALLDEIGFGPTFALEPDLLVPLEEALKVVERDVRAAGITGTLRMIVPDWDVMGMAWVESEGGSRDRASQPKLSATRPVSLLSGWPCVLHASCNSETGHRWRPWSSA